ncbi:MAG TPA: PQQ-binding-like beta-propeller repeat protein, partial [Roseimicrobium sp.]|nr:PQQ-binding-like beta-propeller repeat protein [Roseimicrobium sp.]
MPQQYFRRGLASLFLLQAVFASTLNAADWPRWRGVTVDNFVPGTDRQIEKLPAEPKTLWRVTLGDGNGSPVKAGDKVFILDKIGTNEVLRAVSASTGKEVWQQLVDEAADDTQGKGPRSTPLVDGERIYVTSCRGDFQCRSTKDGALLWKKNFTTDFEAVFIGEKPNPIAVGATRHGNNGSPIIDGESLYVQSGGTNGASVVSLDRKSGKLIWKSQNDMAGYGGAYIALIEGQRQLVCFTADGVIGLALKDGKLLWRFPIKTTWARHVTTPVVAGNVVIVSSHQHGLFGIAIKKDGDKL